MIALQRMQPEPEPQRESPSRRRVEGNTDRMRAATRRRIALAQRRGYVAFARVSAVVAAIVVPIMLYVMLTANLTSLNYALTRAQLQRTALLAQTMREDDLIAKLESRERLAALAAKLKMHDPQTYAVVNVPPPVPAPVPRAAGIALLGSMEQWLDAAVSGPPR